MRTRTGSILRVLAIAAVLASPSGKGLAQAPSPSQAEEVLRHARRHAGRRLLDSLRFRLERLWPRGNPGPEAFLKSSRLGDDLVRWVFEHHGQWQTVKTFPDGTLEVRLSVPLSEAARFLRETARDRNVPIDSSGRSALDALGRQGTRIESVVGVGVLPAPGGSAGSAGEGVWAQVPQRVRNEVWRAAHQDAFEDLWRQVEALRVGPSRLLQSFLDLDPQLRKILRDLVRKGLDLALYHPRYFQNGRCEVDLFLDLLDLHRGIERAAGVIDPVTRNRWGRIDLEDLLLSNGGRRYLRSTGVGLLPGRDANLPTWARQTLSAEGKAALPAQAKSQEHAEALASRASQEEARKNLWEKVLVLRHPCGKGLRELAEDPARRNLLWNLVASVRAGNGLLNAEDRSYSRPIEIDLEKVWKLVKDWK